MGEYALAWASVEGDADDGGGSGGPVDSAKALRSAAAHATGLLEMQRGDAGAAAAAFSDSVGADPAQAMSFKGLGVALNAAGMWATGGAALAVAAELSARAQPSTAATFAAASAATVSEASKGESRSAKVARRQQDAMGEVGSQGQLVHSFRGDGLVSFHRAFSLWALGDVKSAAERFGEATHMAPRFAGSYAALSSLLAIEGAHTARRDCEVARLAPEPVMLALRMAVSAPSVVKDDGLRKKDALVVAVRRL
jgi:hypothetical protein